MLRCAIPLLIAVFLALSPGAYADASPGSLPDAAARDRWSAVIRKTAASLMNNYHDARAQPLWGTIGNPDSRDERGRHNDFGNTLRGEPTTSWFAPVAKPLPAPFTPYRYSAAEMERKPVTRNDGPPLVAIKFGAAGLPGASGPGIRN